MDLTHRERSEGGVPVLELIGDVDLATLPSLYERVNRFVLGVDRPCAVIDLTDLVAIQAVALGVFLEARLQLRSASSELELVCDNPNVWSLFTRSGLDATFALHRSVEEACGDAARTPGRAVTELES
jgi:anti-anti-sigma factor